MVNENRSQVPDEVASHIVDKKRLPLITEAATQLKISIETLKDEGEEYKIRNQKGQTLHTTTVPEGHELVRFSAKRPQRLYKLWDTVISMSRAKKQKT